MKTFSFQNIDRMTQSELNDLLDQALFYGNLDIFIKILETDIDKVKVFLDVKGKTLNLLFSACVRGRFEIVKILLETESFKVDIDFINDKTLLLQACRGGSFEIVKYLLTSPTLKEKADINVVSDDGSSALFFAAQSGNLEMVDYLLTSSDIPNFNIDIKNNHQYDALMVAATWNHVEVVKYLLESPKLKEHASILEISNQGKTAFMFACMKGALDVIKYFMENDNLCPNPYMGGNNKETALILAYKNNHKHVIEYLLYEKEITVDDYTLNWIRNNVCCKDEFNMTVIFDKNLKEMIEGYHFSKTNSQNLQTKLKRKQTISHKVKI